jgi:hypothetical protein
MGKVPVWPGFDGIFIPSPAVRERGVRAADGVRADFAHALVWKRDYASYSMLNGITNSAVDLTY